MRVGIVAWAGSDNLGDEILLHSLISCVRSVHEGSSFVVFAPHPARVTELHQVAACPMPTLRAGGSAARQVLVQRTIRGCDILLIGPGTVFQERSPNLPWPGTLALFARILAMARLAGTPVVPLGVGVREGGTPFGRQVLRVIGAGSLAVGTRDRRSASYFGRKAQVIGDMAYALRLPDLSPAQSRADAPGERGDRRLAVSLRPLAADVEAGLVASVSESVARLCRDGWRAGYLPMAYGRGARGEDDRTIYERAFRDSMDLVANPLDRRVPLFEALDGWLRTLASHRLVLAARLHAALLAVALGVPTVAIAYERKVHDAFVDLGLDRFVVAPTVDSATLCRTAVAAVEAPEAFRAASARIASQAVAARQFVASVLGRVS